LHDQLQSLRLDASHVYAVQNLRLRRGPLNLTFIQGKLALYAPLDGRITGAVFTGNGRVTLTPREPSEKLSLLHFLGVPLLDQNFTGAYLRFTDETAVELDHQLEEQAGQQSLPAVSDPFFTDPWDAVLPDLNTWHSLRILCDWLGAQPRPYFYAGIFGSSVGPFDILMDSRREEPVLVGQARLIDKVRFFETWVSLPATQPGISTVYDFQPLSYTVATTIHADRSLDGDTMLKIRAVRDGERVLALNLAPELQVRQITDGAGNSLPFFPSTEFDQSGKSGSGTILIVLNQSAHTGQEFELDVDYRGTVISDAGNDVLFVGERGSWYAHLPGPDRFVPFDLTFRWPRHLTLVATGTKVEERQDGETRVGHWITPQPIAVAGFNLGEYERYTAKGAGIELEVYSSRELETALARRVRQFPSTVSADPPPLGGSYPNPEDPRIRDAPPPSNSAVALTQLGKEGLDAVSFLEKWNGPFPFAELAVSQIPGSFGQGWPGLLYLPTLAFLLPETQHLVGIAPRVQEQVNEIVPFHEIAHQWWGNEVGVQSYRDTWIFEAMANYLALLYSDSRKPSEHILENFLESFRQQLLTHAPGSEEIVEETGPLSLGYRLASWKDPTAYDAILYGKGTWVIHMLRMMLREPDEPDAPVAAAQDPDARFIALLHDVLAQHRFQAISTADLQRAVEGHMTRAMTLQGDRTMDWFFDEWVSQTGLPSYAVEFQVRVVANRFQVRGTLHQDGVPDLFTMPVPLYAGRENGKPVLLGSVVTSGPETKFQLWCAFRPTRVLIDPQRTILSRTK